jgi:hypothetical protein
MPDCLALGEEGAVPEALFLSEGTAEKEALVGIFCFSTAVYGEKRPVLSGNRGF